MKKLLNAVLDYSQSFLVMCKMNICPVMCYTDKFHIQCGHCSVAVIY